MSRSLNRVELIGHLGKDAETKFTQAGVACTTFSMATSQRWKDKTSGEMKEQTEWHRCVLWRSENLAQYLTKGKQVYVEGRLQTRSWDDQGSTRYTTEVVVSDVLLLSGDKSQARGAAAPPPAGPPADNLGITDDDVPF